MTDPNLSLLPASLGSAQDGRVSGFNVMAAFPACLFLLCLGIGAFGFIYLGTIGWPGLHWDAALYGVPVINVASGKGWEFGSYTPQIVQRDNLDYDFHGLLHVLFYGSWLNCFSWLRYIFAQSCVNALTFVVYSTLYAFILVRQKGARLSGFIFSVLLGFIPGAICIGLQGRPEQLAPLILGLSLVLVLPFSSWAGRIAVHGLTLGLLFILSPLVGLFYASIVLFYWYAIEQGGLIVWMRSCFYLLSVAVLVSGLLIGFLTPFSPLQWCQNLLNVSSQIASFKGFIFMFRSGLWGFTLLAPFWNLIALLFIGVGALWLWLERRSFLVLAALIFVLILFNEKMCDYSYTPFIPYAICLGLIWSGEEFDSCFTSCVSRLARYAVFAVSLVYSYVVLLFFWSSLVIPREQLSLEVARERFKNSQAGKALLSGRAAVGFPPDTMWPSMVVLGNGGIAYASFVPSRGPGSGKLLDQYERKTGQFVKYMIYPQSETSTNISPPPFLFVGPAKFTLVENNWVSPGDYDFRLGTARLTNRYNFAIYKR